MYSTFIYVIGQSISKVFKIPSESIWVSNIPKAEPIIKLCEAIALARAEEDLDK
jgi:Piezo non-specific cation channel, R-Ras-binding domain